MPLGAADEQKEPAPGTVEAWGRSPENSVSGWYGQRKGYRGRFGMSLPPLLEALGLVELEHTARNNRCRRSEPRECCQTQEFGRSAARETGFPCGESTEILPSGDDPVIERPSKPTSHREPRSNQPH